MKGGSREEKWHKRTGGGRTWYEKRETLTPPVPRPHFLWWLIHINKAADKTRFSVRVKAQPVHGRSPKIRVYIEQIFECF